MTTPTLQSRDCPTCRDDDRTFPESYVIHLEGDCCRCSQQPMQRPCHRCSARHDCGRLHQSVVVRRESPDSLRYVYDFETGDFIDGQRPHDVKTLTLILTKHEDQTRKAYSACVILTFSSDVKPVAWYCGRITDCCNIGTTLRRHSTNALCNWPKALEVNNVPTPDFVPPQPEWARGNPDDLNDAPFSWPALDVDRMEQSPETFVRYFNGELHLRIKDVSSGGYGTPWGHTRIYSNRLSNSYDFGNGTNWLVHEWPQLVRRKTSVTEVASLHPRHLGTPTGCTLVLLRGTRNALWFDEFHTSKDATLWLARFGSKHVLEYVAKDNHFQLVAPNGHVWQFHPFSPSCVDAPRRPENEKVRDRRLDGKLIAHVSPGGLKLQAVYKDGLLCRYEREAEGWVEQFVYDYFPCGDIQQGRIRAVTWGRKEAVKRTTSSAGERKESQTKFLPLRRAEYSYYKRDESHGNLGDLKTVTRWISDGKEWKQRQDDVQYYRYERESNGTYCQGLLQCVVGPEAYHRMKLAGLDPLKATTHEIQQYADIFLTYHRGDDFQSRRVSHISLCGGGRQHTFGYERIPVNTKRRATLPPASSGYNVDHTLTIETRPDGTRKEVRANFIGQSRWLTLVDGPLQWTHAWEYDNKHAGLTMKVEPSGVAAVGSLRATKGKFVQVGYLCGNGAGVAANQAYLETVAHTEGQYGNAERYTTFDYRYVNAAYGIRVLSLETQHGVEADHEGNPRLADQGNAIRSYYHEFAPGRPAHLLKRETKLPSVDNSYFLHSTEYLTTNTTDTAVEVFDDYGNLKSLVDHRRTQTVNEFDHVKGAPRRQTVSFLENGEARSLITGFVSDNIGRITKVVGPAHRAIVPGSVSESTVRTTVWTLYKDISGEVWTVQGYQTGQNGSQFSEQAINPVTIERRDLIGRLTDSIVATRSTPGAPTIQEVLQQQSWTRWQRKQYNNQGTELICRTYHSVPAAGEGTLGINFEETQATAELSKRERVVVESNGEKYTTSFDARGLALTLSVKNEPLPIVELEYDFNQPAGNGNVTQIVRKQGGQERRVRYGYDYRDRQSFAIEADGGRVDYACTNHSQVTKILRTAGAKLVAQRAFRVDKRGRICGTQLNGFTPYRSRLALAGAVGIAGVATDILGAAPVPGVSETAEWVGGLLDAVAQAIPNSYGPLEELRLFDDADQLVAIEPHGGAGNARSVIAIGYDALGRETARKTYLESAGKPTCYSSIETAHNAVGLPILVTGRGRFPQSAIVGTGSNRELGNELGTGPSGGAGFAPAYCTQNASWYDPLGRTIATAEFGEPSSFPFASRPASIPSHANITVAHQQYDQSGTLAKCIGPYGVTAHFAYDHAGRNVLEAANVSDAEFEQCRRQWGRSQMPTPGEGLLGFRDDATMTTFSYTADGAVRQSGVFNSHTGTQTTRVNFGATPESLAPPNARLPSEIIDAEGRRVKLQYNRLGEVERVTDASGTSHVYVYDKAGRVVEDRVVDIGQNVDGGVRRVQYVYDAIGRLSEVQSFDAPLAGRMLNRVVRRYGNYNELLVEAQLHTPGLARFGDCTGDARFHGVEKPDTDDKSIPGHVSYFYEYPIFTVGIGGSRRNSMRLRTTWYPGDVHQHRKGKRLSVFYADTADRIFNRASQLHDSDYAYSHPVAYQYWSANGLYGADLVNTRPIPAVSDGARLRSTMTRAGSTAAFSTWDKGTRTRYHQWQRKIQRKTLVPIEEDLTVNQYFSIDQRERVRLKKDVQAKTNLDESYAYDRMDRVTNYQRGTLNGLQTAVVPHSRTRMQSWQLDQNGNWRGFEDTTGNSPRNYQARRHTPGNRIETIRSNGNVLSSPRHDAVGNMTAMPMPGAPGVRCNARYDAWNRLTVMELPAGKVVHEYDGLGRRTVTYQANDLPRHYYYDQAGRVLTETVRDASGTSHLDREYVWDANRADHLVCRIRHLPTGAERLFPLYGLQGNVLALVDDAGAVKERFTVDPRGQVLYLQPDFSPKAVQSSEFDWQHDRVGLRRDPSGLYFGRANYYHVDLGRLLPRGPIDLLPESQLNAYAQDFPIGDWQPPHSGEALFKWVNEQSPWIKFGIGAVAMLLAVGWTAAALTPPVTAAGVLAACGAVCGGLQGGIGASLHGGNFGDIMLGAGVGALFGAVCPWGGIGALAGSAIGYGIARATCGNDPTSLARGWEWGGMLGGVAGSLPYGIWAVAPELGGGLTGGSVGYIASGGDWDAALTGASFGMMLGGAAGGLGRSALSPRSGSVGLSSKSGILVFVPRTALGAADDVAAVGARRSVGDWWRFRSDLGGETVPVGFGAPYTGSLAPLNRLGLRHGYSTVVHNFDAAGSWFARTDTAAHEGFHALVAQHLPSVWRVGDLRIGRLPIGAPVKYFEEVLAYSVGHAGAFRIHAIPFALLEAFGSLSRAEAWTTVAFAVAGYGAYNYYSRR